ncbi:MAG TPA: class I SAM-dependent methyltransferase [Candidatus Binataceae bacterium]|nr:class I SAM-dependent methyltransferase [Candidatus Binataceae bacterium]
MNSPLTQSEIEKRLSNQNLDELLRLWQEEQGVAKKRDLELIAAALPFSAGATLRVLDLCCGPGDVGRYIHARYPSSEVDCVDRDVFLISMCTVMNRRTRVPVQSFVRDLWKLDWHTGLGRDYDVVATANAFHWFDSSRTAELFKEVFGLLRHGGVFLFVEPACAEQTFAGSFAEWKSRQPARYSRENWERFWNRANEILGYDHVSLLGTRDPNRIDDRMSVAGWTEFLKSAGFDSIDVLLRDADEAMLGARKP